MLQRSQYILLGILISGILLLSLILALMLLHSPVESVESAVVTPTNTAATASIPVVEPERLQPQKTTLIAGGDVLFARYVETQVKKYGIEYPLVATKAFLSTGDITFVNLETPILDGAQTPMESVTFRSPVGTEKVLANAGVNIVSLANNHSLNFGTEGILNTLSLLKSTGIEAVGAGQNSNEANAPVLMKKNGVTFAWLAYVDTAFTDDSYEATATRPGAAFMNTERMKAAVAAVRSQADVVIVTMHSGDEFTSTPNSNQKNFAHAAIDAGADLIIGHHPHVLQSAEVYKEKYIFYSLGNFVFDQKYPDTQVSALLHVTFSGYTISEIALVPIRIRDYAQPSIVTDDSGEKQLSVFELPLTKKEMTIGDAAIPIYTVFSE